MVRFSLFFVFVAIAFVACDGQHPQSPQTACVCPPAPVCASAPTASIAAVVVPNSGTKGESTQPSQQAFRSGQAFQLSVNYMRPLSKAIALGRFNGYNDDITSERFPPNTNECGVEFATMRLFSFGRYVSSDDAVAAMTEEGFRPATLRELLSFAAQFPEEQLANPIVALGSVWESTIHWHVPCLTGLNGRRDIYLYWLGLGWDDSWRFLARKS